MGKHSLPKWHDSSYRHANSAHTTKRVPETPPARSISQFVLFDQAVNVPLTDPEHGSHFCPIAGMPYQALAQALPLDIGQARLMVKGQQQRIVAPGLQGTEMFRPDALLPPGQS